METHHMDVGTSVMWLAHNSKMGNSAAVLAVEASITPAALTKAPQMVRKNVGLALCEMTELREGTEL